MPKTAGSFMPKSDSNDAQPANDITTLMTRRTARMLQSRIRSGRFNMKLRYKIAKLFDLDFAEWQLAGYFSDSELEGEESD